MLYANKLLRQTKSGDGARFGISSLPFDREAFTRRGAAFGKLLAFVFVLVQGQAALAQHQHSIPLFTPASNTNQQGFARIVNRSDRVGTVTIHAIDDSGRRFGPVSLSLDAMATTNFNSRDLEHGNPSKGLSGGVGAGDGNWRMELTTDLDIQVLAYLRTTDGFLTSLHDVSDTESLNHHVPIFNPGSNTNQQSLLRLINIADAATEVVLDGLDDRSAPPPAGKVRLTLSAEASRIINAQELEQGGDTFEGRFGDGTGKWQLFISADHPIQVMSLLATPTGHLTNLSGTGTGNDSTSGSVGNDSLAGGSGDDVINPGSNTAFLDAATDTPYDVIYGSRGDDTIIYTDSGENSYQHITYEDLDSGGIRAVIDGIDNRATIDKGSAGTDTIIDIVKPLDAASNGGGFGIDGTRFDDVFDLTLRPFNVVTGELGQWMQARGNAGNDEFIIHDTAPRLGAGYSHVQIRIDYKHAPAGVDVDLGANQARNDGYGDVDTFTGPVWELRGSTHDDTLRGSPGDDRLDGYDGDDVITPGGSGRDGDAVKGSNGNDRIVYTGSNGYQSIEYRDVKGLSAAIDGAANSATIDKGSAGTDTIVDVANPMSGGGFGFTGTPHDDVFDLTVDNGQWMQVAGQAGNDTFTISGAGSVRINYFKYPYASNGIQVDLSAGRARNDGHGGVDTFNGHVGEIRGTDHSDVITGSGNNESFIGRAGDDVIDGAGGFDRLRFDRSCCAYIADLDVNLGAGTATGRWNDGNFSYTISNIEHVRGSGNRDVLTGDAGDNRLEGREGDDILRGGSGADTLIGGDGGDTFIFGPGHGTDTIRDFTDGADRINLNELSISSYSDVSAVTTLNSNGDVVIDLSTLGGGEIRLQGFSRIAALDASDFLL